ncbi:hypothetical protein ES702_01555 [subsurface metagenome]
MGGFEELGKRLDKLTEKARDRTQEEMEKAGGEIKEWGKKLDELGEKIKKTTQEGVEKVSGKTKGIIPITKLKSEIKEIEKDVDSLTKQLGAKTYQFHLEKKIGNVELKKLGGKITQFKKDIEAKKKGIQRLRQK